LIERFYYAKEQGSARRAMIHYTEKQFNQKASKFSFRKEITDIPIEISFFKKELFKCSLREIQ
jgi:hypothetical protein